MLRLKYVFILKANPNILKCDGGIKMWMWLCVERELFRIWKQSWNEEDRKKCYEAKKDAKRVVYMAVDQKPQEAVEKVVLCCDGPGMISIDKGLRRRKILLGIVVLKMKVGQ